MQICHDGEKSKRYNTNQWNSRVYMCTYDVVQSKRELAKYRNKKFTSRRIRVRDKTEHCKHCARAAISVECLGQTSLGDRVWTDRGCDLSVSTTYTEISGA